MKHSEALKAAHGLSSRTVSLLLNAMHGKLYGAASPEAYLSACGRDSERLLAVYSKFAENQNQFWAETFKEAANTKQVVESLRDPLADASREVEAEEEHGSTHSLPKGWSIGRDGRTRNQFGDAA